MDNGWVRMYRKTLDSAIFADPKLFQLFWYCVMKANSQDAHVPMTTGQGNTIVRVKRGQFISGRKTIAKDTKQKEGSIRRRLLALEKLGNVNIKATSHYSIITIVNYDQYQDGKKERTGKRPTSEQAPTTNKSILISIIDYLNKKLGSKYGYSTKITVAKINARLAENHSLENFIEVIDKKADEWLGTDMEKHLNPETLFGNKFEKYLNQKIVKEKKIQKNDDLKRFAERHSLTNAVKGITDGNQ